jgi:hypothetical protein
MSKRTGSVRGFGRNGLHANPRDRNITIVEGQAYAHRDFFVPSFGVKRPLVADQEAKDFHARLTEYCRRKPYVPRELGSIGITLVDMGRFQNCFRRADVQPEASDMLQLARNVRDALGASVKSKPHVLRVPLGGLYAFGEEDKAAIVPHGWAGFDKDYMQEGDDGIVTNKQIAQEVSACIGEITQFVDGGLDGQGEYVEVSVRPLQRQTPHIMLLQKIRGATISNNEIASMNGQIAEFLPDELRFFDPVVNLSLVPTHNQTPITNNTAEFSVFSAGFYVRRPHNRIAAPPTMTAHIT